MGQIPHTDGNYPSGKSQFIYGLETNKVLLDAAEYADKNNLWDKQNKAKVFVSNGFVGFSKDGPTQWLNIYRSDKNMIHGAPTSTPGKIK